MTKPDQRDTWRVLDAPMFGAIGRGNRMPTVQVDDVSLKYDETGEGHPLVLIMGLGCTSDLWLCQVNEFAKRFRVITFDNRGVGASSEGTKDYSIEVFADDAAALLRKLGVDRAHVLGVSMGGTIGQQLVLRHPDLVDRLVLACTWCRTSAFGLSLLQAWSDVATGAGMDVLTRLTFAQYLTPSLYGQNPEMVQHLYEIAMSGTSVETYVKQNKACARHDAYEGLESWFGDTLVLVGEHDGQTTMGAAREIAARVPKAELVVLKDVGHGMMWEDPDKFNQAVIDFLERA